MGSGYGREEIKTLLLSKGYGFTGKSVSSVAELCLNLLRVEAENVLSSGARQEVLRELFSRDRVEKHFTVLRKLKRRKDFLKKLDNAIQTGRLTYAHDAEAQVQLERLFQNQGAERAVENRLHTEVRKFSKAYEAWMEASGYYDLPILLRHACARLDEIGFELPEDWPKEIWYFTVQTPESLEALFWEKLSEKIVINRPEFEKRKGSPANASSSLDVKDEGAETPTLSWEIWHSFDDAAEELAEQILKFSEKDRKNGVPLFSQDAVLIPDEPAIRRSLKRALEAHRIPLAEPRDPTQLLWDESIKWALKPLELVARGFQRPDVVSWIKMNREIFSNPDLLGSWTYEIESRGMRSGLHRYSGGNLTPVYEKLKELSDKLAGKKTLADFSSAHIQYLRSQGRLDPAVVFIEKQWKSYLEDLEKAGESPRKAAPLAWYERLVLRLREASPPVDGMKPEAGLRIYRLQQAPIFVPERVWIFGLPPHALDGDGTASQWFSEYDREVLSLEFDVRSKDQVHDERLSSLVAWISGSKSCHVLDAHYDWDGTERESVLPVLEEIGFELGVSFDEAPKYQGAHSFFKLSYTSEWIPQAQTLRLSPLPGRPTGKGRDQRLESGPEISATELDRYSRCSFQALAYHRWNLRDIREPEPDLWPDVRGNLLHSAVRNLLRSRTREGKYGITPEVALDLAWQEKVPRGLIQSARLHRFIKSRLVKTLVAFCEKERIYFEKSGATPIALDDRRIRLPMKGFSVMGQPDRIDEFEGGLFVMDYKSSGTLPHGSDMLERGYRLQLPFYGVALNHLEKRPVCGLQFIELDASAGRKSGILFKKFNGKDPGQLSDLRANSKSLISQEPEEVWKILEEKIQEKGESYISGYFEALPNVSVRAKECDRCRVQDLCGYRRLGIDEATGSTLSVQVVEDSGASSS